MSCGIGVQNANLTPTVYPTRSFLLDRELGKNACAPITQNNINESTIAYTKKKKSLKCKSKVKGKGNMMYP